MTAVLHVITGLGIGGAERTLSQLVRALHASDISQHVVSIRDDGFYAEAMRAEGVAVTSLGVRSPAQGLVAQFRLAAVIARLRPRVLQGWMYHGNVMAALAHRLSPGRQTRRLMWNLRASNMDDARYGRIIRVGALLSGWPETVVANSQFGMAHHLQLGFKPRHVEIIPNGIDTDRFRPDAGSRHRLRSELGLDPDTVVAAHIARVDPMKDHASFLAAMERLPHVTALLVGAGTRQMSTPPNVRALGQRDDVPLIAAASDLVVSTSAFGEGFSNALAEGMSAGLVPVATDVGDARLIVGETGIVVGPGRVDELTSAIAKLAGLPASERQCRGMAARERIIDNFTLQRAVDRFVQLYGIA